MIEYQEYPGDRTTGDGQHVAVSVDGVRIAAAVRLRQRYSATDPNEMKWYLLLCAPGVDVRPTKIHGEDEGRAWLAALATLYCATTPSPEVTVSTEQEPPAEPIFESDVEPSEAISGVELDELFAGEDDEYWREVESCCGGRNYWCDHYRCYPPAAVADRW